MVLKGYVIPTPICRSGTIINNNTTNIRMGCCNNGNGMLVGLGIGAGVSLLGSIFAAIFGGGRQQQPAQVQYAPPQQVPVQQQPQVADKGQGVTYLTKTYNNYTWTYIADEGNYIGTDQDGNSVIGKTVADVVKQLSGKKETPASQAQQQIVNETKQRDAISKLCTDLGVTLNDADDDDYTTFKYNDKTITVTAEGKYKIGDAEYDNIEALKKALGIGTEQPENLDGNENKPIGELPDDKTDPTKTTPGKTTPVKTTPGKTTPTEITKLSLDKNGKLQIENGNNIKVSDASGKTKDIEGTVSNVVIAGLHGDTKFKITTASGQTYEFYYDASAGQLINTKIGDSAGTDQQRYHLDTEKGYFVQENTDAKEKVGYTKPVTTKQVTDEQNKSKPYTAEIIFGVRSLGVGGGWARVYFMDAQGKEHRYTASALGIRNNDESITRLVEKIKEQISADGFTNVKLSGNLYKDE